MGSTYGRDIGGVASKYKSEMKKIDFIVNSKARHCNNMMQFRVSNQTGRHPMMLLVVYRV